MRNKNSLRLGFDCWKLEWYADIFIIEENIDKKLMALKISDINKISFIILFLSFIFFLAQSLRMRCFYRMTRRGCRSRGWRLRLKLRADPSVKYLRLGSDRRVTCSTGAIGRSVVDWVSTHWGIEPWPQFLQFGPLGPSEGLPGRANLDFGTTVIGLVKITLVRILDKAKLLSTLKF